MIRLSQPPLIPQRIQSSPLHILPLTTLLLCPIHYISRPMCWEWGCPLNVSQCLMYYSVLTASPNPSKTTPASSQVLFTVISCPAGGGRILAKILCSWEQRRLWCRPKQVWARFMVQTLLYLADQEHQGALSHLCAGCLFQRTTQSAPLS